MIRKQYIVSPVFQYWFIAFCAFSAVFASGLFYGGTTYFFAKYHQLALDVGMQPSDPFFKVLGNMKSMMGWVFIVTSLVTTLLTTIVGAIFSNKVAGPLSRLRIHMGQIARGETIEQVNFRKGDFFEEVAEAYNKQLTVTLTKNSTDFRSTG